MASHQAIAAVSQAMATLLESSYRDAPSGLDGHQLQFKVYVAKDFTNPMEAGVSVFLYRIYANGAHRTPAGRLAINGQRYQTQLPLDLHLLLTAWAPDASLQHTIAAWMMRILEDTPSLPPGLLNSIIPETFHPEESVEIGLADLDTETMFRIWEVIVDHRYQVSVPYIARNVRIESSHLQAQGKPVQERIFSDGKLNLS